MSQQSNDPNLDNTKNKTIDSKTDNKTNIATEHLTSHMTANNQNLAVLKRHFGHCFDKAGHFDFDKFKQNIIASLPDANDEASIDFYKESYGLDWLGKSYARLLASDATTSLLQADEAHNAKPPNATSSNLLLKGDNLEVLKHLSHAYYEQVKMIYIDPPYNTGSDGFVYQDDRKFSLDDLQRLAGVSRERAERILAFTHSHSNSHSAWLTFMYPRLYIAKQLLRDDGVIFVSIDDNEVAQLRLLMDEIFGEENFIKDLIINISEGGGQAKYVINGHDNLLVYAKNLSQFDNLKRPKDIRGKKVMIDGELYWIQEDSIRKEFGKYGNLHYEEIVEYKDEKFKEKIDKGIENNEYILVKKDYGKSIIGKLRKVSEDFSKFHSILNIGNITKHLTADGIKEVEAIFDVAKGDSPFSAPKPVELLKRIVLSSTFKGNNNDLILDFFAGSGTTADAVMQLNAEDGGNRRYILVQLPEPIDASKNKTAYDFVHDTLGVAEPTIFDITCERLIRSRQKILTDNKALSNPKDLSEQDMGFKIFATTPIWDGYDEPYNTYNSQIELFDQTQLNDDDIKALFITWKTHDGAPLHEPYHVYELTGNHIDKNIDSYRTYYSNQTLYLMYDGFATAHLTDLLKKLDTDDTFNPNTIVAFGYHFDSKHLRELAENVKSYANKKSIDMDFLIRY